MNAAFNRGWEPSILTTEEYFEKISKNYSGKILVSQKELIKKHMILSKLEPIISIGNYPKKEKMSYKKNIVVLLSQDPTNIGSIIRTSRGYYVNDLMLSLIHI